jgi:peptide-methionine (S)-S-oxide reductase
MEQIGFGGGCHWCTEGVFQSLLGVENVQQGWISSLGEYSEYSEAVIVSFNEEVIALEELIKIHLFTHSSTSNHTFREKYRSAVYTFTEHQVERSLKTVRESQLDFDKEIVTQVLPFCDFRLNSEDYQNYLYSRRDNAFCKTYIHPKLSVLLSKFSNQVNKEKLEELNMINT